MTPKFLAQIFGCLVTLLVIFIGCNDFGQVAEKTKKAATDIIEKGRQAGVFESVEENKSQPMRTGYQAVNWQVPRSQSEISIGTFNIQIFGVKKLADVATMDILVNVARQFDCLAIQELRSVDDTVIPRFIQMINANGSRYSFVLGPRQGNSSSKEQYVYLYDTYRIELVDSGFVVDDPQNLLHREPMVSRFRTRTADPRQAFTFALVNVHTDPDETATELPALYQVYVWLSQTMQEDDIIMLGDFNKRPSKYGVLWNLPDLVSALPDSVPTNTRRTKAYDNILFDRQRTREFTGQAGVIDMEQVFGLTFQQAQSVSDHLPVWALFSTAEAVSPMATQGIQPANYGR